MISQTIIALVTLRKQVFDDIYQITGLSDIMRGDTDPQETLGAQQIKTQNGSMRIRDKQQELVRLARDLVEITSEIITEKFNPKILVEMSQTQLPTKSMIQQQMDQIEQQITQAMQNPQTQAMAQQNPQQAQAMLQQAQAQIQKLQQTPTIEQVLKFLKDNRAKSFVLDIETDSTIMADENGEKQRRTEFVGVLGQLLPQLSQMIGADPKTAEFCGELLKFATAPFRVGRSLDGAIDELVEQMKQKGDQPQAQDPATQAAQTQLQIEQIKDNTNKQKIAQDAQFKQAELVQKDQHHQQEMANQRQIAQMKINSDLMQTKGSLTVGLLENQQDAAMQREAHQAEMAKAQSELQIQNAKFAQQMQHANQMHQVKQADFAQRSSERQEMMRQKAMAGPKPGRRADMSNRIGDLAAADSYAPSDWPAGPAELPDIGAPLLSPGPQVSAGAPWANRLVDTLTTPRRRPRATTRCCTRPRARKVNFTQGDINRGMDLALSFSGGGLGIKAYHGSPHDFDRFDLSKIGTGEGAQAYGHGLYFAENEGVAEVNAVIARRIRLDSTNLAQ